MDFRKNPVPGVAEALGQAFWLGSELLAAEVRHDAPGELRQVSGRVLQLGPVKKKTCRTSREVRWLLVDGAPLAASWFMTL
jgi:hypothetical protein